MTQIASFCLLGHQRAFLCACPFCALLTTVAVDFGQASVLVAVVSETGSGKNARLFNIITYLYCVIRINSKNGIQQLDVYLWMVKAGESVVGGQSLGGSDFRPSYL
jgi:hypothetical protein